MEQPVDYCFKIVLVGDLNVGKTSLIRRFVEDSFVENSSSTIGIDFKIKTVSINGLKVKLQLWDTAGQERFKTITNSYLRGAHAVLIVYDSSNPSSIHSCLDWLRESVDVKVRCLVGTKSDIPSDFDDALPKQIAEKHNAFWFCVSSKTDHYVSMMFLTLAERCIITLEKMTLIAEKSEMSRIKSRDLHAPSRVNLSAKPVMDKKSCCKRF